MVALFLAICGIRFRDTEHTFVGVTINRTGPHRTHTGPRKLACTRPEMTDNFASTTN